jgi:hypothetical protein
MRIKSENGFAAGAWVAAVALAASWPSPSSAQPAPAAVVQPSRAQSTEHPWLTPATGDASAVATDGDTWEGSTGNWWQDSGMADALHDRLVIGVRYVNVFLTDDSRSSSDSYLGHITELDAHQDGNPLRWLYAQWWLPSVTPAGLGLELGWTHLEAATINDNTHYSDGDIVMGGPSLSLLGRYPMEMRTAGVDWTLIPRAGVGAAWMSADFDYTLWWHYGFHPDENAADPAAAAVADYKDWVSRGAPMDELDNTRSISLDDSLGFLIIGAVEARHGPWGAELYLRYMTAETDGTYVQELKNGSRTVRDADFPMDNWGLGFGVTYAF